MCDSAQHLAATCASVMLRACDNKSRRLTIEWEHIVIRAFVLGMALSLGLATTAGAAILPAPVANGDGGIVKVGEGCGPGWWRGPHGHCHPFTGGGGSLRGTRFACPGGMHVGPYGHRCWPNR